MAEEQDMDEFEIDPSVRQVVCNGVSLKTDEVEAKLDQGNIQEAESALRDGLSLSSEVEFTKHIVFFAFYVQQSICFTLDPMPLCFSPLY